MRIGIRAKTPVSKINNNLVHYGDMSKDKRERKNTLHNNMSYDNAISCYILALPSRSPTTTILDFTDHKMRNVVVRVQNPETNAA